jgi:PhzF family phenazine biosynthesis protein
LNRAEQNEAEVCRLSEGYGVVGVHMFCLGAGDVTAYCRNFAPLYAIPEEAATGTSNGALTFYLHRRGLVSGSGGNRFLQGEKMGKPSEILSRLTEERGTAKVRIGGRAVLTLRGEVL